MVEDFGATVDSVVLDTAVKGNQGESDVEVDRNNINNVEGMLHLNSNNIEQHRTSEGGDGSNRVTGAPISKRNVEKENDSDDPEMWTIGVAENNEDVNDYQENDNEINQIHDYGQQHGTKREHVAIDSSSHIAVEDVVMSDIIQHVETQKE